MTKSMTAKEFWKDQFKEYPQNDADKLAVAMMTEFALLQTQDKDKEIERLKETLAKAEYVAKWYQERYKDELDHPLTENIKI